MHGAVGQVERAGIVHDLLDLLLYLLVVLNGLGCRVLVPSLALLGEGTEVRVLWNRQLRWIMHSLFALPSQDGLLAGLLLPCLFQSLQVLLDSQMNNIRIVFTLWGVGVLS